MSIKLTKRVAADIMGRGVSKVRVNPTALAEAEKAITREDVRALIKSGGVYAIKEKDNISMNSKLLKKKRAQGRRRGIGRKKGTRKARASLEYKQKIRGQRRILAALKGEKAIDNMTFKSLYRLVKGGTFASKASLLGNIKGRGINISDDKMKQLKHI